MHKAALYKRSNGLQRRDAKQTIDEFSPALQWRSDGCDSLLDIGCGSGDVTIDFLLPILPANFQRLVGVDLSEEMVDFARQQYPHPRISFDKFDLGLDIEKQPFHTTEPFDHITSFYCLHWVQNQERAVQNMYKLLKPDGDMLLVFLAQNPIFEIYKQMSLSKKWAKYMTDVDRFISPYQNSKNPADQFGKLLYSSGFTEYSVDIREKFFVFEGIDLLKSRWTSSKLLKYHCLHFSFCLYWNFTQNAFHYRVCESGQSIYWADSNPRSRCIFRRLSKSCDQNAPSIGWHSCQQQNMPLLNTIQIDGRLR